MACALLISAGVQAQSWTGSEVGEGYALLYNVGTDQYFTRGNGWNTQASIGGEGAAMTVYLQAFDGKYKIRTQNSYGVECLSGGTVYTDQSKGKNSTWTFQEIDATNHVYNIISDNGHGDGTGKYLTAEGGESTKVGSGNDGTIDNAKWKVYLYTDQQAKLQTAMKNATAEAPVDVTAYIKDAHFGAFSDIALECWSKTVTNWNLNGGALENPCAETYHNGGGKIFQTIAVPNGTYKVLCQGYYRKDSGSTPSYLYANDEKVALKVFNANNEGTVNNMDGASASFSAGYYENEIQVVVTGNTLTIGIEGQNDNWTCFDNFRLIYYGLTLEMLANAYNEALSTAQAAYENADYANVTGSEKTALYNAISTYQTCDATKEAYSTAATALNNAKSAFIAAKDSYDAFASEKTHAISLWVTEIPTPNTAEEAFAGINTLKVAEHNTVITKYTTDGSALFIPTWDKENFDALNNEHWSGKASEYFDKWSGNAYTSKIFKEVELPEGHYVFYAAARGQANASTATLKVTIGDNTLSVPCTIKGNRGYGINTDGAADFSSTSTYACNNEGYGWEWRHIAFDLNTKTTVTLAIECSGNNSWVSAGDTRLVTYDNIAVSQSRYEAALEAAKAARDNADFANITGVERDNLIDAINATTPTTKEGYDAAAETLENRLSVFTAAKASYDAYVAYKNETKSLFGDEVSNSVAAPTTAAQAITAVQNLNIAQYNKVATDYTFSCSGLIGDFGSWEGTATVAGSNAKPNYLDREHWSGIRHAYYEQAAAGWQNAAGWTIQYKKTCTLPAGDYVIKVAARSSGGTTSNISCSATNETISLPNLGSPGRGINTSGVASWSDDDKFTTGNLDNNQLPSVGGAGTGWQWRFLPFTLSEQTEVTMTFYAEATSQYQWMSIADGELLSKTKLAEDVIYDEGATNIIENKLIADVTIDRKIKEDFNTVVLPFDLTANQVAAAFGANTEVYEYSENSTDANNVTINFTKNDGSIKANTPVLIKATAESTSQTFNGVQVVAPTDAKVSGKYFDFVGIYTPDAIKAGDYFIGSGALYKSEGNTSIKAFRAYLKVKENVEARNISFVIDDKATAIEGIEIEGANDGKIYNLKGQEVKNPQKGVYIQNGKIIIIK